MDFFRQGPCSPDESDAYDPYVRVRCGVRTHFHEQTLPHVKPGGPEWAWDASMKNELKLQRVPRDENIMVVEVYDKHRLRDTFLGGKLLVSDPTAACEVLTCVLARAGGQVDLLKYMEKPNEEFQEEVLIFETGIPTEGTDTGSVRTQSTPTGNDFAKARLTWCLNCAAQVTLNIKWVPAVEVHSSLANLVQTGEDWLKQEGRVLENGLKSVTHLGLTKDYEDQDKDEQDGRSLARQKQKTWDAPAGELIVTVLRANDLRDPDDIIRDLSTFVDSSAIYVALAAVVLFLLCSFFFYWLYLGSDIDIQKGDGLSEVKNRLHGGNGDWDVINTWVFLVTTFSTVGFGNHPSLVHMRPPCAYPSASLEKQDPTSILLPEAKRAEHLCTGCNHVISVGMDTAETRNNQGGGAFDQVVEDDDYQAICLSDGTGADDSRCWILAGKSGIFHFGKLSYYQTYDTKRATNFTELSRADDLKYLDLSYLEIPGSLREYSTFEEISEHNKEGRPCALPANATDSWKERCFSAYRENCDRQLDLWKIEETKKDWAKVFTIFFIILGIGLLGNAMGAIGDQLLIWVRPESFMRLQRCTISRLFSQQSQALLQP
jgi:hypothetical protein